MDLKPFPHICANILINHNKMKKVIFSVAVAAMVALGFTSCKKASCIECNGGGMDYKYCKDDFPEDQFGMSWETWSNNMAASPYCKKVSE